MCLRRADIEALDPHQTRVSQLALDQDWLVYGPAGTGKTIIALNRLARLRQLQPEGGHAYVSFSKVLKEWVSQAATEMGVHGCIASYDQMIFPMVASAINVKVPKLDDNWTIDWEKVIPLLAGQSTERRLPRQRTLIVDEAQDLPIGFFRACKFFFSRIFVLMDEHQKTQFLADSRRLDVAAALGIDEAHQLMLRINYRNPREIKELSETFFEGEAREVADLPPENLQRRVEGRPSLLFLPFVTRDGAQSQVQRILEHCADRPDRAVLVVAPAAGAVERVHAGIVAAAAEHPRLQNRAGWSARRYVPRKHHPVDADLCGPGIVVSTALNTKGTEFDAVFLVDWHLSVYISVC